MKQRVTTTTGVSTSAAVPNDIHLWGSIALQAVVTGSATYTIEQTLDNVFDSSITPTWFSVPDATLVAATTSKIGTVNFVPAAFRINQTVGSGSVRLTVLQAGVGTA